jgi:two-component system, chemotaxis family, CheB/CheR fusion protein
MASDRHPDPQRDCPDGSAPGPDAPGLRVLVVEDDADLAASLAGWLGRCGHEVRVATDGTAALRATEASHPDVMLLDIGLPGMDGYEVAERVHEELAPAMPKAPLVIAVTGRGGEAHRRRSRAAGIDLHLTKPVDVEQLSRVLGRFQRIIR